MMTDEVLLLEAKNHFKKDIINLSFDFEIKSFPKELEEDERFIFEDEFFMVNLGEVEKFTSDYIYQSKLTLFKNGDSFNFGGYTPDWARKINLLKDKNGNALFSPNRKYHVELTFSKYRAYININNGEIISTYGNAREEVDDVRFYVRKGFDISITNTSFTECDQDEQKLDKTLQAFIDKGIATNYMYYHIDKYGLYFDRMNIIQNIKCTTRNTGQYAINAMFDMYTNTKKIGIEYTIMDLGTPNYPYMFGFFINRNKIEVPTKKANIGESHYDEFIVPSEYEGNNRLTLVLPNNMCIAVKKVVVDDNSVFYPVKKDISMLILGDSISECSECIDTGCSFPIQLSLAFNACIYNQAISGRTFNDYNVLGDYYISPNYVIIANGTNSYCMGTAEKKLAFDTLEKDMRLVLSDINKHFPNSKIIALLPIWRSDEDGPNFTLKDTVNKMIEVYSSYKNVKMVDCYDFVPKKEEYFSNKELMLHPSSIGHDIYGKELIKALIPILKKPYNEDDKHMADIIISQAK